MFLQLTLLVHLVLLNYSGILPFVKLRKPYQSDFTLLQCFIHSTKGRNAWKQKRRKEPPHTKNIHHLTMLPGPLEVIALFVHMSRVDWKGFCLLWNLMEVYVRLLILTRPFGNNIRSVMEKPLRHGLLEAP